MSSFVKSVERLGGLSFFKLSHKGSAMWRRMSSFVKSVKRSGGLIFLQFVEKRPAGPFDRFDKLDIPFPRSREKSA